MTEFSSAFHNCTKHLVVATHSKKNLPRVQFEESATDGPNINPKVVRHSKNYPRSKHVFEPKEEARHTDLGSSVKSANEIWRNLILYGIGRGSQIANLQQIT